MLGCLDIFLISNIQNIGTNRLFLLHLSFNFTICPIFICEFIFLLIVFHIPLCNVRQPYKGCPLTCFLAEITRNETVWRMRTNNVKRVYFHTGHSGAATSSSSELQEKTRSRQSVNHVNVQENCLENVRLLVSGHLRT